MLFTFYNIYIKTNNKYYVAKIYFDLHSTIFILKLFQTLFFLHYQANLHSTIFILKPMLKHSFANLSKYLHSTIFILKQNIILFSPLTFIFTFYNIYIKTGFV